MRVRNPAMDGAFPANVTSMHQTSPPCPANTGIPAVLETNDETLHTLGVLGRLPLHRLQRGPAHLPAAIPGAQSQWHNAPCVVSSPSPEPEAPTEPGPVELATQEEINGPHAPRPGGNRARDGPHLGQPIEGGVGSAGCCESAGHGAGQAALGVGARFPRRPGGRANDD